VLLAGGVGVAAWRLGPLFGVPLAIAAALAMDSFYIAPYRTFDSRDWVNYPVTAEGRVFRLLARKHWASRRTLENPSCRHQPSPRAKGLALSRQEPRPIIAFVNEWRERNRRRA
jgi:hypothetical protein